MSEKQVLTRNDLYEKVWKKPMVQLAKEFGISDRGLAKICKKYDIPRPGLGYWAKLEFGKKVKKVPLPKNSELDKVSITINPFSSTVLSQQGRKKRFISNFLFPSLRILMIKYCIPQLPRH